MYLSENGLSSEASDSMPPQAFYRRHLFLPHATGPGALVTGACISSAIAIAGSWLGLRWGGWMRRIHR